MNIIDFWGIFCLSVIVSVILLWVFTAGSPPPEEENGEQN